MVENLFEQNLLWAVLAAVFWGFASRGARRLPTRATTRSLGRRTRLGLVLLTVSLLVLALRVALAVALAGTAGWLAGADFVLFAAVPLTVAGTAVAVLTLPAYWRLTRTPAPGSPGPRTPMTAPEAPATATTSPTAEPARTPATTVPHPRPHTSPARAEDRAPGRLATTPGRPGRPTTTAPYPLPEASAGHVNGNGSAAADPGEPGEPGVRPALRLAAVSTPPEASAGRGSDSTAGDPDVPDAADAADVPAVPVELRLAAASWQVVVPVRVCFLAALFAAGLTLHPPAPPYGGLFVLEMVLLVLAASGLVLWQQRWRAVVGAPGWRRPSRARRLVRSTATLTAFAVLVTGGWALAAERSRLPERMGQDHHTHAYDTGGGPSAGQAPARDLTGLTGPRTGTPDRRFTLTATARTMRLASGEKVAALAFNGQLPGPELRMRKGELVEVVLVNRNVGDGVTLHWHGVDVPAAEDGVAGVTQDAVMPGERHVYRFRPPRAGTFWYHTHQQSSAAVARGLFGALVVEEPGARPAGVDRTVVAHAWSVEGAKGSSTGGRPGGGGALSGRNGIGGLLRTAFGDDTRTRRERVPAGTPVRLRLVNADSCPRTYSLSGTPFKVAAIDGNDVSEPTELRGTRLRVAGGGRYDVTFRQPDGPVHLTVVGDANATSASHGTEGCGEDGAYGAGQVETASLLLDPTGSAGPPPTSTGPLFDPLDYGSPTTTTGTAGTTTTDAAPTFGPGTRYDRDFHLVLGNSLGFFNGRPMVLWTVNNAVYPDIPALLVREGDLARVSFVNRSLDDHPMHLHGHRMLVLSRNGQRATGSPWWTDTLNIAPGERFEVAFRADNPGLWMDHCHNLDHARDGMVLHLAYDGVTTPYEAGSSTGNLPE
ncbi:multicopper oxidase domain-containing protein [Streptomyces sp. NBC_01451]|uniref:multicopper oxidase domain-containing protein n=1 Tax=Streptomyces sp. NBC_01451 TaxID=2903872 RepID=UPI002E3085A2|nr:multicopper oxidase domain-containing protein [Streptomyces sp. NBC_01451]